MCRAYSLYGKIIRDLDGRSNLPVTFTGPNKPNANEM